MKGISHSTRVQSIISHEHVKMRTAFILLPVGIFVAITGAAPVFGTEHQIARGVLSIETEFLDPIVVDTRSIETE